MCEHECSGATNAYGECLRRYERLRKGKRGEECASTNVAELRMPPTYVQILRKSAR
jgi:hypothetical protein